MLASTPVQTRYGLELYQRLATKRPKLKVLYMSGYTDMAMLQSGKLESGTPFLQKPSTPGAPAQKTREVLGRDDSGSPIPDSGFRRPTLN